MKTLAALAEKGSIDDFDACLSAQTHSPAELFYALRIALLWDQPEKVQRLLDAGANPLDENHENAQLLTHAAVGGNPRLVALMISLGCDPNRKNINKRTPLHDAAYSGKVEAIRVLIASGANPNCSDARGQTPLSDACRNGHPQAAIELIQNGADIGICGSAEKKTPLMFAASMKSVELATLLLNNGSDIEARDFIGGTALMHAARAGSVEMVELLLDAGAKTGVTDKHGNDALQWSSSLSPKVLQVLQQRSSFSPGKATRSLLKASSDGNTTVMKALLAKRASIQPDEEGGESALSKAVLARASDALTLLIQHPSAQLDYRSGPRRRTPLITAATAGYFEMVHILLEAGADVMIADADDYSATHHAAASGKFDTVKLLKKFGADLSMVAPGGNTLLHLAIYAPESFAQDADRLETVSWLLEQQMDPNAATASGITAIMLAALHARNDIVRQLIAYGADVNLQDLDGRTALYHAVSHGADYGYNDRYVRPKSKKSDKAAAVIMALLEAGADPGLPRILEDAARWRWRGAVTLMKKCAANRQTGR